ncbi:MATE family efflux transporter [Prolixibacter denitrificans]|uniref:Multidrug export protein MepA n=1 Tax=Prolixibacter denitrificans TaxID=1541063 RepID=A0A2P8CG05_9BACT|nr:MATE family efflux transporter [Prolixibacter denitrificans]PSK83910.1 putative MATE family efflux protein [Prolixibacter denitrificans]GET23451.1 MATE family efflux transporter [Prolixibacter denitrificans]
MPEKATRDLEQQKIGRLMWQYFVPAFIGVMMNALYNIVDRIFIGRGVGALALSGLSVIFPIMILIAAFGMLIGVGAGVRISINLGKKDYRQAEKVLGNGLSLMVIVSLLVTVIGFMVKNPLLHLFGATGETIGYANDYLNIILLGTIFQVVGFSLNNIIRSEGNAKIAMYSMLLSAGTNLVLDPIFIFGLKMGVQGAAIATVISQILLTLWVLRHFRGEKSIVKLHLPNLKLEPVIILRILSIGMAPFAMQLAASLVQATFNTQLIRFGSDVAVGAMGIINSVVIMIIMSMIAINMAMQPIVGFNYGAKQFHRVKETWFLAMKSATWVAVISFIVVQVFPGEIIRLFNNDNKELFQIGVKGLRIFTLMLPVVGYQVIVSSYFQSIGKAGIAMFLTLLRQVIVLTPLLFILPKFFDLTGVWMAGPVSDFVSACIVLFVTLREVKLLNKHQEEEAEEKKKPVSEFAR